MLQEADTTHEWSTNEISAFLTCQPSPTSPDPIVLVAPHANAPMDVQDSLESVAVRVVARIEHTEVGALVEAIERAGQIPPDIDKQLLGGARAELDRDLDSAEKKDIRKYFSEKCRQRM